ncbi:hypothetical protein [Halostagnicola larsenii]|uniref:hypothetical protein n=1 Tax=Halostagnicola larsenii TaxID=353800 RepID=UPI0006792033|nr:hypothetical protein [Halostagnicola larsenii]
MNRPLGLEGFATQSRLQHALTVVGALVVFWIGYFGGVWAVYGELSALSLESNIAAQRVGGAAGGVVVWTYFSIAFVRGYGGPVLNTLAYPLAIVIVAPFPARWLLFGPDIGGLVDRFVGLFVFEPLFTTMIAAVPGLGACAIVLALWASTLEDDRRREWERRHLSTSFYETFVERDE